MLEDQAEYNNATVGTFTPVRTESDNIINKVENLIINGVGNDMIDKVANFRINTFGNDLNRSDVSDVQV